MSEIEENSPAVVKKKRKIWPWVVLGITIALILSTVLVGLLVSWDQAKAPWDFVSSQILGMAWLNALIGSAVEGMWGSAFHSGLWGKSIQFFVYDFIKIGLLLCFLIFLISYIQSFFPPEKTKKILSKYNGIGGNIIGALLGTVTPFCSCSSIPIFIGFTRAGLSSGITFSFLISSPLVDLGSLLLLVSIFGWPIAIVYVIT
ncbi:MAG: permease, partial [Massilibacteroides sp.]|nr:permease [Massilibacteroides sp.]